MGGIAGLVWIMWVVSGMPRVNEAEAPARIVEAQRGNDMNEEYARLEAEGHAKAAADAERVAWVGKHCKPVGSLTPRERYSLNRDVGTGRLYVRENMPIVFKGLFICDDNQLHRSDGSVWEPPTYARPRAVSREEMERGRK
jgi:hypothetical protein